MGGFFRETPVAPVSSGQTGFSRILILEEGPVGQR